VAKWKKVPPHRNPNYEEVGVVRCFYDSLKHLDAISALATAADAVLVVGKRGSKLPRIFRKKAKA
jgi:hypothetical protein